MIDDGADLDTVMQSADLALYHAKVNGRNQTSFFDASMTRDLMRRKEIEAELRAALQRDELSIFFQPIVDLETGRIKTFTERGILLEVCLTSNVQTGATPSYAAHPLGAYLRAGVPTVLCTDNRLMSDTTVPAEYGHAQSAQGLTVPELATIARAGYEYAFLPEAERGALLARFDAAVAGGTVRGAPS